jgi:hypothetical protein
MKKNLYVVMESQQVKEDIQNKLHNIKHKTGYDYGELILKALCVFETTLSDGK